MSITLQAAPSHQKANSYISLAEADDYFDKRPDSDIWTVGDDKKRRALIMATDLIDSYRFHDDKLYSDQRLKNPRSDVKKRPGTPDSGTTTTVVCDTFADDTLYEDDYWNYGAIRVTDGTNKNEVRLITNFVVSSGTFTVEAFSSAIDTTSDFVAIKEIPRPIKEAVCETAIWLLGKGMKVLQRDQSIEATSRGNISTKYRNSEHNIPLPAVAELKLKPYISRTGKIIW